MSRRQQNPNQIIRKDGRNVFVEALRVAFPIEKVQLKFMSYDMNQNKGHRAQDVIDIYLDFAAFLRMSHDIMTGCIYGKLAQEKKAGKPGIMTLYQGGVSTAALAASQKSRPDGKALARKLSVFIGDKYPLCFVAESGPGESIQKGLIAPRWGNKPEHKVVISMSADDAPKKSVVFEVIIVPSSNSMAAHATPVFSALFLAATVTFLSSVVILACFIRSSILYTSLSDAFSLATLLTAS